MKVYTITVGPLQENCYIVSDGVSGDAVIIDPGYESDRICMLLDRESLKPSAIWLTHAHVDHVGAVGPLSQKYDIPVAVHSADRPLYDRASSIGTMYGMIIPSLPEPLIDLSEVRSVVIGKLEFSVNHLPGHAPGHVAFVGEGASFSGDILFQGSIGRTDLPLCDSDAMISSLAWLSKLPGETVVYPGHGPSTSISHELVNNPFLSGRARPIGT